MMLERPRMTSARFLDLPSTTCWKRWDGLYLGRAQVSTWMYSVIIFAPEPVRKAGRKV